MKDGAACEHFKSSLCTSTASEDLTPNPAVKSSRNRVFAGFPQEQADPSSDFTAETNKAKRTGTPVQLSMREEPEPAMIEAHDE